MAGDEILKSWAFRLVSNPVFRVLAQVFNFCLLWLLVDDLRFAAAIWVGFRISSFPQLREQVARGSGLSLRSFTPSLDRDNDCAVMNNNIPTGAELT